MINLENTGIDGVESVDESTPLIEFAENMLEGIDLSTFTLLTCHHILEHHKRVLEALFRKGLKSQNVYVVGKAYSTSNETLQKYIAMGVNVSKKSSHADYNVPFDVFLPQVIEEYFSHIPANKLSKVLLWDDGGNLIKWVYENRGKFGKVTAIEQTSSGYNRTKDLQLDFPVVNMARSDAKLNIETPFIAEENIKQLERHLGAYLHSSPKKVLIYGGGFVGQAVAKSFKRFQHSVDVFDTVEQVSTINEADLKSRLKEYDVIIGSTGEKVFGVDAVDGLKDTTAVVSVSSSDREFSASEWRIASGVYNFSTHQTIEVRGRKLLNNGYPLNFDGKPVNVPLKQIQITAGLEIASLTEAVIALEQSKAGYVNLSTSAQQQITSKFFELQKVF